MLDSVNFKFCFYAYFYQAPYPYSCFPVSCTPLLFKCASTCVSTFSPLLFFNLFLSFPKLTRLKFSFWVKVSPRCCPYFLCFPVSPVARRFYNFLFVSTLTNSPSVCLCCLPVLYPVAFEMFFLCLSVFFSLFSFGNFFLSFLNASAFITFFLGLYHPTLTFKILSCLSLMPLLFKFSFCVNFYSLFCAQF